MAAVELVTALEELAETSKQAKSKKLLRSTKYSIKVEDSDEELQLTSWHMQDWAYKQDPSPFPTQARGLFTSKDQVVVRGYDKFFNVGEVTWTKVSSSVMR